MYSKMIKITLGWSMAVSAIQQSASSWLEIQNANSNLQWGLQGHGCNCPAAYDEFAIGGTSTSNDDVDRVCQSLRQCSSCASKEAACGDMATFEAASFNWDDSNNSCANLQAPNSCAMLKCECMMDFINDMNALGKDFNNFNSTAGSTATCQDAPGNNRACCKNAAGDWKMFNDATHKCENGQISLAGKIPTVKACDGKQIDVTMFVDGSGSVSSFHFYNSVIPFCNDFAAALKLSPNGIHMQFFQWSRYGRLEFGYQTDAATFKALTVGMGYYSSVTYTYENLRDCYNNHIKNKGRAAAKKVIVNITDGKPTGDTVGNKVRDYVRDYLTPAGVVHIVVGVGTGIPWSTLVNMSTIKNTAIHQGETTFLAGLDRDKMSAIGDQIGEEVCRG